MLPRYWSTENHTSRRAYSLTAENSASLAGVRRFPGFPLDQDQSGHDRFQINNMPAAKKVTVLSIA